MPTTACSTSAKVNEEDFITMEDHKELTTTTATTEHGLSYDGDYDDDDDDYDGYDDDDYYYYTDEDSFWTYFWEDNNHTLVPDGNVSISFHHPTLQDANNAGGSGVGLDHLNQQLGLVCIIATLVVLLCTVLRFRW